MNKLTALVFVLTLISIPAVQASETRIAFTDQAVVKQPKPAAFRRGPAQLIASNPVQTMAPIAPQVA